ncbi:hypothetical protein ACFLT9_03475 [Acidobacteriota bacterium]
MENDRLDGWKEISLYMSRDIRTCQRWEKECGLPVSRVDSQSLKSKVFSYKSELDLWFKSKNNPLCEDNGRSIQTKTLLFASLTLIIGAAVVLALILLPGGDNAPGPINWDIKGRTLVFTDLQDKVVWTKDIDSPFNLSDYYLDKSDDVYGDMSNNSYKRSRVAFSDIDGDRKNEVLTFMFHDNPKKRCLVLFDHHGKKKWSNRIELDQKYPFSLQNNYQIYELSFEDLVDGGGEEILALWGHKGRFPSIFQILDKEGRELYRYEHTGILQFFTVSEDSDGNKHLLLGGTNNLLNGDAVLIVIDCKDLRSGLAPPYSIPSEYAGFSNSLKDYVPIDPVYASQKYYIRIKKNELCEAQGIKWMFTLFAYMDEAGISLMVNYSLDGLKPIHYFLDGRMRLYDIRPGGEFMRLYSAMLESKKIDVPLEIFLKRCLDNVFFWDGKGWIPNRKYIGP